MNRKIFKNKYLRRNSGFTLVETLIAVSIFTVSILGLLVTLSGGLADTGYAKKKIAAAYLAQEGVEFVRNMRDTYMIYAADPQNGWDAFKTHVDLCRAAEGCYIDDGALNYTDPSQPINDPAQVAVSACNPAPCPEMVYDPSSGKYGYSFTGAKTTDFIRQINIEDISSDEVKVTATVFWMQESGNYRVVFSDNLLNWIE